jgi:hypothetical protein
MAWYQVFSISCCWADIKGKDETDAIVWVVVGDKIDSGRCKGVDEMDEIEESLRRSEEETMRRVERERKRKRKGDVR